MITVRRQVELETVFLITMAAAVSIFFVAYKNNNSRGQFNIVSSIPPVSAPAEAVDPQITVASQISPDGTKKVIMKVTENSDSTKTYDFSVSDENGANEQHIFTKILDLSSSMEIPFNTWSPDNKYLFIREQSENDKKVLVFKADGASFENGETFLDAAAFFKEKNTGNIFEEATGWASETLIIINTKKPDGSKAFSYWFEIPSKSIIQLSTEF
ncbi:MAG: hypothetical protein HY425_03545 [Candidatus Levybacteria bacterium]|nr:hypothetical protein [Candidatus Levybacteria bacterium]